MTKHIGASWRQMRLGSVTELLTDGTHFSPQTNTGIRMYLTSKNVRVGRLDLTNVTYISEAEHREIYSRCPVRCGDLLLTKDGANTGNAALFNLTEECSLLSSIAVLRGKKSVLNNGFLLQLILSDWGQNLIQSEMAGQAITRLTLERIASFRIPLPPFHEQKAISEIVAYWDDAIEKTERLIAAKSQRLSYLREHHLTKPKQSRRIKLKAATHESTARNGKRLGREAIMAVTKQVGLRPMREETIAAAIDRYKVVRPQAFAYNPMRLNIGSIAISSFDDDVLVSPDYVVFECNEAKLLPGYLNHLRRTRHWASHFEAAGSGGVRIRIYYDDLGAFAFALPPLVEQARVLAVLDAGVAEIETLERYLAALKKQKRGLMQKLLTGQWRGKPTATKAG